MTKWDLSKNTRLVNIQIPTNEICHINKGGAIIITGAENL